jgi:glyceraldehyde 3-phosphate dehydrogenase
MIRIGINGFGRIGRAVLRIASKRNDMQVVAINDLYPPESLAYLLKYDTVMGTLQRPVRFTEHAIELDGRPIRLTKEHDPSRLPWKLEQIDVVVEATGVFRTRAKLEPHLQAGAQRVVLTVPPKDELDAMVVLGVNDHALHPGVRLVSGASCTTNCLAPVAHVLDREFGIEQGMMTTIHAYTNDQRLADVPHKDMRRARAAAENLIPTTTGAARAVGKVLPQLAGKLDGMAIRVPVPDGSVVDLIVRLQRSTTIEDLRAAMRHAADHDLSGILQYSEEPLVSSDIVGNPHSSIFDALASYALGPREFRVVAWYDNEWGYSRRMVDLIRRLGALA